MTEVPKIRKDRSVWVYGSRDLECPVIGTDDRPPGGEGGFAIYCESPAQLADELLASSDLQAVVCPTASPFSHDSNLMRAITSSRGTVSICGLSVPREELGTGTLLRIEEATGVVRVGAEEHSVSTGLRGSDEALACLSSGDAVCYRPSYLYDEWLGDQNAKGLQEGVGRRVRSSSPGARLDDAGRVWLFGGPFPREIATWILTHPDDFLEMVTDLVDAMTVLYTTSWEPSGILGSPDFLAAFHTNTVVAPFVGFPLYSLTQLVAQESGGQALESMVTEFGELLPLPSRSREELPPSLFEDLHTKIGALRGGTHPPSSSEIVGLTVLLSDVRRMVIDTLRRNYPIFAEHTRHRKLS